MSFKDVFELVKSAAASMPPGGMLLTETFTYDDAMAAAELMDPKVDPGMNKAVVPSVEDRLADGSLGVTFDDPTEVLRLFDKLFQLETAFRNGDSLPQTVFICLYLHAPCLQAMRTRLGLPSFEPCTRDALFLGRRPRSKPLPPPSDGTAVTGTTTATAAAAASSSSSGDGTEETKQEGGADSSGTASSDPTPARLAPGSVAHTLTLAVLAYCTSVIKIADFERHLCRTGSMMEEEDVAHRSYTLDMLSSVTHQQALSLLLDAEAALLASVHSLRSAVPAGSSAAGSGSGTGAGAGAGAGTGAGASSSATSAAASSSSSSRKSRNKRKPKATKIAEAIGVTVSSDALSPSTNAFPVSGVVAPTLAGSSTIKFQPVHPDGTSDPDPARAVAVVDALVARLHLKRSYYLAHLQMDLPYLRGLPEAAKSLTGLVPLLAAVKASATEDSDATAATAAVPTDPVELAKYKAFQKVNPPKCSSSAYPGFDSAIMARVVPTAVPRFKPAPSYAKAWDNFGALITDLLTTTDLPASVARHSAYSFSRVTDSGTFPDGRTSPDLGLDRLFEFLSGFSWRRANVVARARLWVSVGAVPGAPVLGVYPPVGVVRDELQALGIPVSVFDDDYGKAYANNCMATLHNMLRVECMNFHRCIRASKFLLMDCYSLMLDGENNDRQIMRFHSLTDKEHRFRLYHWMKRHACRIQMNWLQMVLCEELFVTLAERNMVYWQLDYTMGQWVAATEELLHAAAGAAAATKSSKAKAKKGGGKKKGGKRAAAAAAAAAATADVKPTPYMQYVEVLRAMGRAQFRLTRALIDLGIVPDGPTSSFRDPKLEFEHQFDVFRHSVQPTPLRYQDYVNTVDSMSAMAPATKLEAAKSALVAAKMLVDVVTKDEAVSGALPPQLRTRLGVLAKVAVVNQVFLGQLKRHFPAAFSPDAPPDTVVPEDFEYSVQVRTEFDMVFPAMALVKK